MKKLLLLSALLIFACSSDDSSESDDNNSNVEYLGTYRGSIDVYLNGSYHSTLNNHSMTFVSVDDTNEVLIQGNLIITNYCNFNATYMKLRCNLDTTYIQLRCNLDVTYMQL